MNIDYLTYKLSKYQYLLFINPSNELYNAKIKYYENQLGGKKDYEWKFDKSKLTLENLKKVLDKRYNKIELGSTFICYEDLKSFVEKLENFVNIEEFNLETKKLIDITKFNKKERVPQNSNIERLQKYGKKIYDNPNNKSDIIRDYIIESLDNMEYFTNTNFTNKIEYKKCFNNKEKKKIDDELIILQK